MRLDPLVIAIGGAQAVEDGHMTALGHPQRRCGCVDLPDRQIGRIDQRITHNENLSRLIL